MAGLATVLGSGAMTNSIEDVTQTDTFLILGSNTTEAHPVIGAKIKKRLREGAKLVVVDPRKTEIASLADVHLQLKPGTDVALLNALLNVIIEENLVDEDFIAAHTEGFEAVKGNVKNYTPEYAAKITGIDSEKIRQGALLYGQAAKAAILYTMGITQHTNGVDNVRAIANLALATGNLGKPGTGLNPLRGQNNVQGACDMGALPSVLPGYVPVANTEKLNNLWQAALPTKPGLTIGEMMTGAATGKVKAMYIMGENPVLSDPDGNHVIEALKNLELLVVQDIFLTETAELADVVLPAASFAEKDGTFVNTERRVQRVRRAVTPVGDALADWQIISNVASKLGHEWGYNSAEDVFNELCKATAQYAGLSYQRLEKQGIQWPCPNPEHPGTPILHSAGPARGKGLFSVVAFRGAAEDADQDYPFIMTTGRILYHYHTGSMTRNASGLKAHRDRELVEVNPADAQRLGLEAGDFVRVSSRRGQVEAEIALTDRVPPGVVFMTFHYKEAAANLLTNSAVDPTSKTPELKVAAVSLEKI